VPEYLSPGVYVEETSFRPKSIEGVSTSTAGFVGPTRTGPITGEPPLLTSFADFQRIYGGLENLNFESDGRQKNYLAYGVRAFFEEGGQRCYVARVYDGTDGLARKRMGTNSQLDLTARFPGQYGEVRITFTLLATADVNATVNGSAGGEVRLSGVSVGDTVFVDPADSNNDVDQGYADYVVDQGTKSLVYADTGSGSTTVEASKLTPDDSVHRLTVRVEVQYPSYQPGGGGVHYTGGPESLGTFTPRPGSAESLTDTLAKDPSSEQVRYATPFYMSLQQGSMDTKTGAFFVHELFDALSLQAGETITDVTPLREDPITLSGGSDGNMPTNYAGTDNQTNPEGGAHKGLGALQDLDDVSIVAAPGYSALPKTEAQNAQGALIGHCERLQYRIAVLDTPSDQSVGQVRDWRGKIDSTHAAIYYPWITIFDPSTRKELNVPPSGHVAGIYARNDIANGVHKAPANEVVRSAIGFEKRINKAQQDVLNPEGVNCFRFFEGRGYRLWGARMATSDSEYKYVNIRRYLAYLERSIDEGTQIFVFENNGSDLWRNVRRTIGSFLMNEWRSNRLMGTTPDEAFFVRCDRSTMTQNDIDNGRLICEIGVALFRPAEFVIFRIGQKLLSDTG